MGIPNSTAISDNNNNDLIQTVAWEIDGTTNPNGKNASNDQHSSSNGLIGIKKPKYNTDIVDELVKFGYGTKQQIMVASTKVVNPNDINEVAYYIMKHPPPQQMDISVSPSAKPPVQTIQSTKSPSLHPNHLLSIGSSVNNMSLIRKITNSTYTHEQKINNVNYDDNNNPQITNKQHICLSMGICDHLLEIIRTLRLYQNEKDKYNNPNTISTELLTYLQSPNNQLISNYHHLLNKHINEDHQTSMQNTKQFEFIYKQIMNANIKCDINKCNCFIRNSRNREIINNNNDNNNNVDDDIVIYLDILDTIHCNLIHSYDIGYRVNLELYDEHKDNDNNDNNDNSQSTSHWKDASFEKLNSYLMNKTYLNKIVKNKYITDIHIRSQSNQQNTGSGSGPPIPPFGEHHYYWNRNSDKNSPWFIIQKYKDLKEEILSNNIHILTFVAYNNCLLKSKKLLNESSEIKKIKSNEWSFEDFNIQNDSVITPQNLMSIIFYTDYHLLCNKFINSWKKIAKNDNLIKMKERNSEFFNWSKLLCETVHCYGTEVYESSINYYYHNISMPMIFQTFTTTFKYPISTTTKLEVATMFNNTSNNKHNKGMILKLQSNGSKSELRYFNCIFYSSFSNEDERLFINSSDFLVLNTIYSTSTNENYYKFFKGCDILRNILNGNVINGDVSNSENDIKVINHLLLKEKRKDNRNYLGQWFHQFCLKRDLIQINLINKQYYASGNLNSLLFHSKYNNLLLFDRITNLFPNCRVVESLSTGDIDWFYLLSLAKIIKQINFNLLTNKYCRLKEINLKGTSMDLNINQFLDMQALFLHVNWDITSPVDNYGTCITLKKRKGKK